MIRPRSDRVLTGSDPAVCDEPEVRSKHPKPGKRFFTNLCARNDFASAPASVAIPCRRLRSSRNDFERVAAPVRQRTDASVPPQPSAAQSLSTARTYALASNFLSEFSL
jgi:hypothetical protein